MYLLIPQQQQTQQLIQIYLHPTMYLLIQYAQRIALADRTNLHPTMYLLILSLHMYNAILTIIYIPLCIY